MNLTIAPGSVVHVHVGETVAAMKPPEHLADDAPPMLSPLVACTAQIKEPWYAVEVQGKYEKALAWKLVAAHLPYYLPLQRVVRRPGGIKQVSALPLFPNYLFVAGDAAVAFCNRQRCKRSVLPVPDQAELRRELANLEIVLFSKPEVEVFEAKAVGQRVRVAGGPFEGAHGEVEELLSGNKSHRLVIRCTWLGRSVGVEIDRDYLEAI